MKHSNPSHIELELLDSSISISRPGAVDALVLQVRQKIMARILSHIDGDTSALDQYMACAPVAEIGGAYLCTAFYQSTMNDVFTRMGFFMGAARGFQPGTVVPHGSCRLANYRKLVAGHNLPGQVILEFYRQASPLTAAEKSFRDGFLGQESIRRLGSGFYVIGTAVQNSKAAKDVVTHEIHHAQYGLDPVFRSVVNRFWTEAIPEADRRKIRELLGELYNPIDSIIIDEAQAYLLQSNAGRDHLKEYAGKYAGALRLALANAGAAPVGVG